MTTALAEGTGARPNIYSLLDQRVARHGKSLYDTVKSLAPEITPAPSTPEELQACVWTIFGLWSADLSRRRSPQNQLTAEHLGLMDEIAGTFGADVAASFEEKLQEMIGNQLGRHLQVQLKVPNQQAMLPLGEVTSINAYTAFAQRTALLRFQPHTAVEQWVLAHPEKCLTTPGADVGLQRLANEICGIGASLPGEQSKFQRVFADFIAGVSKAASPDRAAVVQSALLAAITRSLRRAIKEQSPSAAGASAQN